MSSRWDVVSSGRSGRSRLTVDARVVAQQSVGWPSSEMERISRAEICAFGRRTEQLFYRADGFDVKPREAVWRRYDFSTADLAQAS